MDVARTRVFVLFFLCLFFFNDTATTEIYTLSLHDALPICRRQPGSAFRPARQCWRSYRPRPDRKSTRLNSSHANISYAVFCLKKKVQSGIPHRFVGWAVIDERAWRVGGDAGERMTGGRHQVVRDSADAVLFDCFFVWSGHADPFPSPPAVRLID